MRVHLMLNGIGFLIILVLDAWTLWHCWSGALAVGPKVLWTLLVVFFPLGGPFLYVLFGRARIA